MTLNARQERFVAEYLVDLNATQAAIRAGYSKKTSYAQGQRLLKHAEVRDAIEAARSERAEKTKIDAEWLLRRLAEEAKADVNDLYDSDGGLKPVREWPKIWRQGLVAGIDVDELHDKETGTSIGRLRKVRLSDRTKRLELIGKHVGVQAFKDQIEHSGGFNVKIDTEAEEE